MLANGVQAPVQLQMMLYKRRMLCAVERSGHAELMPFVRNILKPLANLRERQI
jgi:hypothetical protein